MLLLDGGGGSSCVEWWGREAHMLARTLRLAMDVIEMLDGLLLCEPSGAPGVVCLLLSPLPTARA